MTRKKLPRVTSASSSDHYHGSERDTSLEDFVVEDASDLKLKTIDALEVARKRILAKFTRDRRRKPVSFDENEYNARMAKLDAADKKRKNNKFVQKEAIAGKSMGKTAQSASARLQRDGKQVSYAQPLQAFSAPVGRLNTSHSASRSDQKRHKTVTKNVVALFRKQQALFKFAQKKDELEVTNPLTQLLYATGCLPMEMFIKSIASENFTELHEYSNQISLRIYAGDLDEALSWLILMDADQLKIHLAQIYDENIRHQNRTKTNQVAIGNKLKWIAFLFYLTSRCSNVHVDEFAEKGLALLEPSERMKLRPLLRSFDKGGANGRNYGLDYYVCTFYDKRDSKSRSASQAHNAAQSSEGIRSSNIMRSKRRRGANSAKSNALEKLRQARKARQRLNQKRTGSSKRISRSREMALKRKRSALRINSTSRSKQSTKKKPRRRIMGSDD